MSNEKSHYSDILMAVKNELMSFFSSQNIDLVVLGGTDTPLANGIKKVCMEKDLYFDQIEEYVERIGQLNIDVFLIVINPINKNFDVIIIEVKDVNSLGLMEYSQMIGYCLSSFCKYGLLINVDSGASKNLTDLLTHDLDLRAVNRILSDHTRITHQFGIFKWNSVTKNIESLNLGKIKLISQLSIEILNNLVNNNLN